MSAARSSASDHEELTLRSELPGRHRWDIPALRHDPCFASAVEEAVSQTSGVRSAVANPLTGRLLVTFDPSVSSARIGAAVRTALTVQPMTLEQHRERQAAVAKNADVRTDPVL